ncbi:MAG: multidrug transporter [Microbacterium sp.]|uniref:multidrug transporter n=1 Tax=unclassified Microbacterium TaxID=2609290 RepID=UPI000DAFC365|nr:multidrug transporter [Microbacterium sp.]PZU39452.1 MAG: multidrug transporter [Microbacterium sp.]
MSDSTGMSADDKRHDQLTSAPEATEADAAARIEVTKVDGVTRIDIASDAEVRPGLDPADDPEAAENEERR